MRFNPAIVGAAALMLGIMFTPVRAFAQQEIMDDRIELAKIGFETGVVTEVAGRTAWARFPFAPKVGQGADFLFYSDGSKPMAHGKIEWVSPVKPFDCLVVDVKQVVSSFSVNDNDDWLSVSEFFNQTVKSTERPVDYSMTGSIAINTFVRTESPHLHGSAQDGLEPVRAYIAALRERKNKTAGDMADAAERALVTDTMDQPEPVTETAIHSSLPPFVITPGPNNELVNYSVLEVNLRKFKTISGMDTVTHRIYVRLLDMTKDHNTGGHLPTDILNPKANGTAQAGSQNTGAPQTLGP